MKAFFRYWFVFYPFMFFGTKLFDRVILHLTPDKEGVMGVTFGRSRNRSKNDL